MKRQRKTRIALYTRQPFVAHGVASVLRTQRDLQLVASHSNLPDLLAGLQSTTADILLVHLMNGISLADLHEIRAAGSPCRSILWGQELEDDFAFQAMQMGVRGILRADTPIVEFLAAVRSVQKGEFCFERDLLEKVLSQKPVFLSPRQREIISLVARGCRNKEIACAMGITEGTVKVYLYKLFKKLGINDRLDMALFGRKNLFSGHAAYGEFEKQPAPSVLLMPRKPGGWMVQ